MARFEVREGMPGHEPFTVVSTVGSGVVGWFNSRADADAAAAEADEFAPEGWTGYANPLATLEAGLEVFHLPGRHDQRTHGHRGIHLDPSNVGVPAQPQSDAADNAAKWHRDLAGFDDLVAGVGDAPKSGEVLSDGQLSKVTNALLSNDVQAVVKNFKKSGGHDADWWADADMLSSLTGRLIGAPVPRVLRTGPGTTVADRVHGTNAAQLTLRVENDRNPNALGRKIAYSDAGKRLGLLDLLTGNLRSDPSTWMVDDQDRPIGIAGEYTFADLGNGAEPPKLNTQIKGREPHVKLSEFGRSYVDRDGWKDNPLTPADVEWLRARVDDLKEDFAAMERPEWHKFMRQRLDAIAPHAKGTTNLFAPQSPKPGPADVPLGPKPEPTQHLLNAPPPAHVDVGPLLDPSYGGKSHGNAAKTKLAEKIMNGHYAGYDVAVESVSFPSARYEGTIEIEASVLNDDGEKVGLITRQFARDSEGKLVATHYDMRLAKNVQGGGFAQAYNDRMVAWYRRNGFDRIEIATSSVGGYAWARAGYYWRRSDGPLGAETVRERLRAYVDGPARKQPHWHDAIAEAEQLLKRWDTAEFGSPEYPSPLDVAMIGRKAGQAGRDATWLGKEVMIGSNWQGVKKL